MKYDKTAADIVKNIGGKDNINTIEHCFTRLRFSLKDNKKATIDKLEKIEGVIGAQFKGGQLQIIIGTNVSDAYAEVIKLVPLTTDGVVKDEEKKPLFDKIIDFLSGVFIPIAIALGGAGMIKALLALAVVLKWTTDSSGIYIALNIIGDAAFYFMPFMLAVSTSRKLKVNTYLAVALAGMLMYPTLINGAAEGLPGIQVLGLSVPFISYASSVFPIVLSVITLKLVFNLLNKFIPKSMEMIITSGLALIITGLISLIFLAPAGTYLGNYVSNFFLWLFGVAGPFAGAALGGSFSILVMSGMAYAFFPVVMQNFGTLGYDYILFPIMVLANVNQAVASFAVSFKIKDKEMKTLAVGASITAFMGITEPAMYSVNLRYKKPFYASLIGSAAAGFTARLFDLKMFSMAGSGLLASPAFLSEKFSSNFMNFIISLVIGMAVTFALTLILTKEKDLGNTKDVRKSEPEKVQKTSSTVIGSVGNGSVVKLTEVPDATFSSEIMGKGVAVDIQDGHVISPVNGTIKAIFPTNHAIGILSDEGVEILIHIGVDTVKIEKAIFNSDLQQGDTIEKGETLISFDYEDLKAEEVFTPTIVIVSNSQNYETIQVTEQNEIVDSDDLMFIN